MKNKIVVKTYVVNKNMPQILQENKFVYTINAYVAGNTWSDSIAGVTMSFNVTYKNYVSFMKAKFNCIEYDYRLFYFTKKECKEAIEFIDSLLVMNKLLQ